MPAWARGSGWVHSGNLEPRRLIYHVDMPLLAMLLHEPAATVVRGWWDLLERELGLQGLRRVPFPHVTLLGYSGLDHGHFRNELEACVERLGPITLRTSGLGLFFQPHPVIYLPVVRSRALTDFHREMWESVGTRGGRLDPHHAPDAWTPHLTLAQADLTPESQLDAVRILSRLDLSLEFEVRNLTLFEWIGPRFEPLDRYPLLGERAETVG